MKNNKTLKKIAESGVAALFIIIGLIIIYGLSWIVSCGIIKLIAICFGLTFKWSVATGIWLATLLLRNVFNITVKK